MSILDNVMNTQAAEALRNFDPHGQVVRLLGKLSEREHQIVASRYGLTQDTPMTLENIGKLAGLTRERVRQIEKAVMKRLQSAELPADLRHGVDLIFQVLEEHGNIMREDRLLSALQAQEDTKNERSSNAVIFILHLVPSFNFLKETDKLHRSWHLGGFDRELFDRLLSATDQVFAGGKSVLESRDFFAAVRRELGSGDEPAGLTEPALESMVSVSKLIDKNPFGEWGPLVSPAIRPHDVGDKAYLVLQHRGEPAHYSVITDLINKHLFDERTAHKETVHNELIKDQRFVLVGRGIYALAEWGYRPGVVADIIEEILRKAGRPLGKEEIIAEVGKQRVVKKNTIIVGLSNRARFQKTPDNKYTNINHVS